MAFVKAKDGTDIYYKDWGTGKPLYFHHGWPLSSDDWDAQMIFFVKEGFRVVASDRRGHGRSGQSSEGHDMDTYASTDSNPDGVPMGVFDEIREGTAYNRPQYFKDFTIPFFGYNRDGADVKEGIRDNWWRQGMMGSVLAHHHGIKAFSETDFTEDLKSVDIPVLIMHGEDDQIVPIDITAKKAIKLLKNGKLITYPGFPHGMPVTEAATINKDLLAFFKE